MRESLEMILSRPLDWQTGQCGSENGSVLLGKGVRKEEVDRETVSP